MRRRCAALSAILAATMNRPVAASRASPVLTLLALLGCGASCANAAGAAGGAAAVSLPEVQITATRVAEAIDYVPAPLTVIRGEDLRRLGGADLRAALATVAGADAPPRGRYRPPEGHQRPRQIGRAHV